MNKYGKGNALFIILIPIFLVAALVILDTFISYSQQKSYKDMTENIIKEVVNNDDLYYEEYYEEIKRLYELNNYETDRLIVEADDYSILVENEHAYYGVFSSIFGTGEEEIVKLFGIIDFKAKRGSKTIVKVEATYSENNELEFEYIVE